MDIPIAQVLRYYDKIGVAIIEIVNQPLKIGDTIHISGDKTDIEQTVKWLQVEYSHIEEAGVGQTVAIKTDKQVYPGDMIYLVTV